MAEVWTSLALLTATVAERCTPALAWTRFLTRRRCKRTLAFPVAEISNLAIACWFVATSTASLTASIGSSVVKSIECRPIRSSVVKAVECRPIGYPALVGQIGEGPFARPVAQVT